MNKAEKCCSFSNIGILLFLINTLKPSLLNILDKYQLNSYKLTNNNEIIEKNENIQTLETLAEKKKPKNSLKIIKSQVNSRNKHTYYLCDNNKIILVKGIKIWEKYGIKNTSNYSKKLFEELTKININNSFFDSEENKSSLINMFKRKIKQINLNKDLIGSSTFTSVYFNEALDKMISVSVGNILYSILKENENSHQKYDLVYLSSGQYHDINVPFQLSPLNQDYNYIRIQYHNLNLNDIILLVDNKQTAINELNRLNSNNFNFKINKTKKNNNFNVINEDYINDIIIEYKIISQSNEEDKELSSTSITTFSSSK